MAGDPAESYVTYGRFVVFAAALISIVVLPLTGVAWTFWEIRGDFFVWRELADERIDGCESEVGDLRMEVRSLCQHIETLHGVRGHGCPRLLAK